MGSDAAERPEPPVTIGEAICAGRFHVKRLISGDGGTAVTYEARDELLGEDMAVKIAREAMPIDRQMFADQFLKIVRLRSPFFPAPFGYFEHTVGEARYPVEAQELVRGVSLTKYLQGESEMKGLEVARQLALALDAVDVSGMRHGDITGSNVLVRDDIPVLIDPDSAGRASVHGARNDDFGSFFAVIAASKLSVAFPIILALLDKVDRSTRPFREAEKILKHQRPDVMLTDLPARRRALRDVYQRQSADARGAYATLVRIRRLAYDDLGKRAEEACTEVGILVEPADAAADQANVQREIACLDSGIGELRPATRRFKTTTGRRWDLLLCSNGNFPIPSPYGPSSVCGVIDSDVCPHDGSALISERLRVIKSDEAFSFELQTPQGWVILPEDFLDRALETMIRERVAAFPTHHRISGDKRDPDGIGEDYDLVQDDLVEGNAGSFATARGVASLKQQIEVDLSHGAGEWVGDPNAGTKLSQLHTLDYAHWQPYLKTALDGEFAPKWGAYFLSLERFDLVRVDGRWYLEIVGTLANAAGERIVWRFPLLWLQGDKV